MRVKPWGCLSLVLSFLSCVQPARALDKPSTPAGARDEQLKAAEAKLDAGEEAAVKQALSALAELGGDGAARAIAARLHRGLPPQLIGAAIDALVLLNRPTSSAALLELTQHRRSQIRSQAIAALSALKLQSAQAALLYALDDPSADVRVAAVEALGVVGNSRAVPALLVAAERGVAGAWRSLGRVARPQDVASVLQRAPDGDVSGLRPALDALIVRQDWSVAARTHLLAQLASLGTPSVRAYLSEQNASEATAPQLKRAIADTLARFEREHPETEQLAASSPRPNADPKAPKGAAAPPNTGLNLQPAAAEPRPITKPQAASVAEVHP